MAEHSHIATGAFYCMSDSLLQFRDIPQESFYLNQDGTWGAIDPQLTNDTLAYQSDLTEHNVELQNKITTLGRTFNTTQQLHPAPLAPRNAMYEQTFQQEWPMPLDIYNRVRYMSPSGPIGGSLSEASSPSAYTSTSISSPHFIQPSVSPNMLPSNLPQPYQGHVLANQYQPWEAEPAPSPYVEYRTEHLHAPVQSQVYSMFSPKDMVFNADPCITFDDDLQGDDSLQENESIVKFDRHSSFRAPEEVQSVSEEAPTPSTTTQFSTGRHTNRTSAMTGDDGYGEDLGETSIDGGDDRASDADWTSKPARSAKPQRTTTSAMGRKKRSPQANHQQVRISKPASQANNATRRAVHQRSTSRTLQARLAPRQRLPAFAVHHIKNNTSRQERSFPCAFRLFGCDSTFANKNEWKRHVASQHLQLGYYRCDLGGCYPYNSLGSTSDGATGATKTAQRGRRPSNRRSEGEVLIFNDFNRKDLFTQHCRRMHGPQRTATYGPSHAHSHNRKDSRSSAHVTKEEEEAFESELENIRRRCWHVRRKAPSRSFCGFCRRVFDSSNPEYQNSTDDGRSGDTGIGPEERAWEDRMEHLGKHYERGEVITSDEEVDEDLADWGVEVGILGRGSSGRAWLTNATGGLEEATAPTARGHRRKRSRDNNDVGEETSETKRVRHQPLRRTRYAQAQQDEVESSEGDDGAQPQQDAPFVKESFKNENGNDSDSDAEAEDE